MKKLIICITIATIFLCGCSKNVSLDISTDDVTNIVYEDIEIKNSDFAKIVSEINDKDFYDLQNINILEQFWNNFGTIFIKKHFENSKCLYK